MFEGGMMEASVDVSGTNLLVQGVILVISLLLVAFFSSSEAALISANKLRIRHMAQQGSKAARAVSRVTSNHEKFFATILFSENALIIMASSVGTALAISVMGRSGSAIAVATVATTLVIVMFGEITPKSLAAQSAERWSLVVGRVIEVVMKLETVLIFLFTLPPRLVLWLMGGRKVLQTPTITEGELRMLVDIGRAEGMLEHTEAEWIENVFRFGNRQLREVMTPRTEMVALGKGATVEEFLRVYQQHTHTRFPIYEGSIDNVVGTLSVKDVARAMAAGEIGTGDDVSKLLRPAYFVPETKRVMDLLREMRRGGFQMVIAADEFGGVAGLATVKQMAEEIVGSMGEEGMREEREEDFQVIDSNTYQIDAGMSISEANDHFLLGIPEGNYETVAGFLLASMGHIPTVGEHIYHGSFMLEVVEMRGVKIQQVKITRVARMSAGNGGEVAP